MNTLVNTLIALFLTAIFGQPVEEDKTPPPDQHKTSVEIKKEKTENQEVYEC